MKKFLKKYWSHIICLLFFIVFDLLFFYVNNEFKFENSYWLLNTSLIISILLIIGVWVAIIYHIVHAAKSKELKNKALEIIFIYLFNAFYIPCYSLKYVSKDNNYKTKNMVYLIVSILLFIIMLGLIISFSLNSSYNINYKMFNSNDGTFSFRLPDDYHQNNVGEFDAYFTNNINNIGVFIYDDSKLTSDTILNNQEQYFKSTRDNMILIDSKDYNLYDKKIKTKIYSGMTNNIANVYCLSVITFNNTDYNLFVIETVLKENYSNNKLEFQKIIENIELNK